MTIIAWDGETLAADKRSVCVGLPSRVTKIVRLADGRLFGCSGRQSAVPELVRWLNGGAAPADMPKRDGDEGWTALVIDCERRVWIYEGALPMQMEEPRFAMGSGRDYALTAMHLGKSAAEAVDITSLFDVHCGSGCDTLTLHSHHNLSPAAPASPPEGT